MGPKLNEQNGYTLLLAVLIGVLFSVMIVTLITLTTSGIAKNDIREDNSQATGLSQKGITHITNYINAELNSAIGETGIHQDDFIDKLDNLLDSLECDVGTNKLNNQDKNDVTGSYDVCVSDVEDVFNDSKQNIRTRKEVTFKSTAMVDGVRKELFSTMLIGAQAVPDALNYAVGSHCVDDCDDISGEGNLLLHGGVQIEGDLKVDGDIVTTNRGYAYLSGERWINSTKPSIQPGPDNRSNTAKLILRGDVYSFTSPSPSNNFYTPHITRSDFNNNNRYSIATNNLNNAFTVAPEIIERDPKRDKIEVYKYRDSYKYGINSAGVTRIDSGSNRVFENIQRPGSKSFGYVYERTSWFGCGFLGLGSCYGDVTSGNFGLSGNNTFGQFAVDGNLTINSGKSTFQNGLYVGGNLTIGNTSTSTPTIPVEIDGPIFVNGNLTLQGIDAKLNALIYVNGTVTIQYSRINGLDKNGREGSLIIFSDGQIRIVNNSVNEDDPSNIRGYFYSNDTFEMFGVGSNIKINGGISARRIVLNAVRGSVKTPQINRRGELRCDTGYELTHDSCFKTSQSEKDKSRLHVIYNPGIIGTYSDLKLEEPIIYNIDSPQLIERNIK